MAHPPRTRPALPAALVLLALLSGSLTSAAGQLPGLSESDGVLKLRARARDWPSARSDISPRFVRRQNLISALAGDTTSAAAATTTSAASTATSAAGPASTSAAAAEPSTAAGSTSAAAASASQADPASSAAESSAVPAASSSVEAASSAVVPSTTSSVTSNTHTTASTNTAPTVLSGSTGTSSATSSSASSSATAAAAKNDSSSSSGKTWGIVGGVAGGVVAIVAIVFIAWKCSQQRFSSIEDGPDIRWPELQQDAATTLNPAATHRTGGAGFEMGERRISDEWDASGAFNPERQSMMSYGPDSVQPQQHYAPSAYDPYGSAYPPANVYPPQPAAQGQQQHYFDPYSQPAFATSQASYHSGAPPYGTSSPYADDEKEDIARTGTPTGGHGQRGESRSFSQAELDHITLGNRPQPSRQGTGFSEKY